MNLHSVHNYNIIIFFSCYNSSSKDAEPPGTLAIYPVQTIIAPNKKFLVILSTSNFKVTLSLTLMFLVYSIVRPARHEINMIIIANKYSPMYFVVLSYLRYNQIFKIYY